MGDSFLIYMPYDAAFLGLIRYTRWAPSIIVLADSAEQLQAQAASRGQRIRVKVASLAPLKDIQRAVSVMHAEVISLQMQQAVNRGQQAQAARNRPTLFGADGGRVS